MKRRILHCAYCGLGGHAAVLFTLLESPIRHEFDHFVLFFGVEDLSEDYARTCARLKVPSVYIRKGGSALPFYSAVVGTIRRIEPHLVMINGTSLAAPILAVRSLFRRRWPVCVRETQANHLKTRLEWLGSFLSLQSADAVIYLTREYQSEVEQRFRLPWRRSRAYLIPNGVDTDAFGCRVDRDPRTIKLTMIGRLIPIKDHATLIDAMAILVRERGYPHLSLVIAGDGPMRTALEERSAAAGLREIVTFTGVLNSAEIIELLNHADIYVHCTFGETMSNAILQAMAARLPIVASDVRGVSNLLRDGADGILVAVGDPLALANALELLIRSPELRRRLGENGRQRAVTEWSQQRMVKNYRRVMMDLTECGVSE